MTAREIHYNYFRDFDPTIGRYLESDPIGFAGGVNMYAYANANPLRYVDPRGEVAISVAIPYIIQAVRIATLVGTADTVLILVVYPREPVKTVDYALEQAYESLRRCQTAKPECDCTMELRVVQELEQMKLELAHREIGNVLNLLTDGYIKGIFE